MSILLLVSLTSCINPVAYNGITQLSWVGMQNDLPLP